MDLEIIDAHVHILRSVEHAIEYNSYFMKRGSPFGLPAPPACCGTLEETRALMKQAGIARANILMFTWSGRYYRDGIYTLSDDPCRRRKGEAELKARISERIRENNEWALSLLKANRQFSFFCGIDPVVMDEVALIYEIKDKTDRGALGAKIVPLDLRIEGDDPRLWPVYHYCEPRGIPLWTQASGRPQTFGDPARFARVLNEFPRLKLVFSHLGDSPDFGTGSDAEVVRLANKYPNVHADVSMRFLEVADGHVAPEDMVAHLHAIGIDRVLYGSNYALVEIVRPDPAGAPTPQTTQTRRNVEVLRTLPLKDSERELIAGKNFRRLVGLTDRVS